MSGRSGAAAELRKISKRCSAHEKAHGCDAWPDERDERGYSTHDLCAIRVALCNAWWAAYRAIAIAELFAGMIAAVRGGAR